MLHLIRRMKQVLLGHGVARLTLTAGVVAALIAIDPRGARACSCAVQTSEQAFAGSTAVFLGVAREITPTPIPGTFESLVEVELDVSRVWKGDVTRTQAVVTSTTGNVCGFGFQTGRAYLVYGYRNDYGLWVSSCSRTSATALAAGELGLGPGSEPADLPDASAGDAPAPSPDTATMPPVPNAGGGGGCHAGGHLPAGGGAAAAALVLLWVASMIAVPPSGSSRRAP